MEYELLACAAVEALQQTTYIREEKTNLNCFKFTHFQICFQTIILCIL